MKRARKKSSVSWNTRRTVRARKAPLPPPLAPRDGSCAMISVHTIFGDVMTEAMALDMYDWRIIMCVNKEFSRLVPVPLRPNLPPFCDALLVVGTKSAFEDFTQVEELRIDVDSVHLCCLFVQRRRTIPDYKRWVRELGDECFGDFDSPDVPFLEWARENLQYKHLTAFNVLCQGIIPHYLAYYLDEVLEAATPAFFDAMRNSDSHDWHSRVSQRFADAMSHGRYDRIEKLVSLCPDLIKDMVKYDLTLEGAQLYFKLAGRDFMDDVDVMDLLFLNEPQPNILLGALLKEDLASVRKSIDALRQEYVVYGDDGSEPFEEAFEEPVRDMLRVAGLI